MIFWKYQLQLVFKVFKVQCSLEHVKCDLAWNSTTVHVKHPRVCDS
jgi:hypothetical protein